MGDESGRSCSSSRQPSRGFSPLDYDAAEAFFRSFLRGASGGYLEGTLTQAGYISNFVTGRHLQSQVKAAHHFPVDGGHGKEFRGEPAGSFRANDGRGAEVISAHLDAQSEDRSVRDLTRGLHGKAKGTEIDQAGREFRVGSNEAHLRGCSWSNASCAPGCHFVPPAVSLPAAIRILVTGPHMPCDHHPTDSAIRRQHDLDDVTARVGKQSYRKVGLCAGLANHSAFPKLIDVKTRGRPLQRSAVSCFLPVVARKDSQEALPVYRLLSLVNCFSPGHTNTLSTTLPATSVSRK